MASCCGRTQVDVGDTFDPRIVRPEVVSLLRECQRRVPFHLGGGAALAGVHLRHRLSADADLFVHGQEAHRELVRQLPEIGAANGTPVTVVRDGGSFVRASLELPDGATELDVVFDSVPGIEPAQAPIEGVVVDLLFLDRAGCAPEHDLELAMRKDAGTDPGVLAWLLGQFPVEPLPVTLVPLDADELRRFRDDLQERFRRRAVP